MGAETEMEKNSYNPDTHEFVRKDGTNSYIVVPGENNIGKYYKLDSKTPSNNESHQCSNSFADHRGQQYMIDDEAMETGLSAFTAVSEAQLRQSDEDVFKKFIIYEMNSEMFPAMGVEASADEATDTFEFGPEVDGVKSATYNITCVAHSLDHAEYPKIIFKYDFELKYNDKVTALNQRMEMDYYMSSTMHMPQSMYMSVGLNYAFDQAMYDEAKAVADTVVTVGDAYKNGARLVFNGGYVETFSDKLAPNEQITEEKVLDMIDVRQSAFVDHADITLYADEACTQPFAERLSTEYEEIFYVKMAPKTGYTFVKETYKETIGKGTLPFTDEEFAFYREMVGDDEEEIRLFLISNAANYDVVYHNQYSTSGRLLSMTLDGQAFNSNVISSEALAGKPEHELVFHSLVNYDESGSEKHPILLASVLVSNGDDGVLFAGPVSQYSKYYKINTAEIAKASPNYVVKVYKVDHILAANEELPTTAVELTEGVTADLYLNGSKVTTIPADYNGEFLLDVSLNNATSFVYVQIS